MSKSVNKVVLRPVSKMSGLQNAFTFDPLVLFEGTSAEGPATSSSSQAPSKILPRDVLICTMYFCLNCLGKAHFHLLNLHRCLNHTTRLEVK